MLFARFLQIIDPSPMDIVLATFIVSKRMEFNRVMEVYSKRKAILEKTGKAMLEKA